MCYTLGMDRALRITRVCAFVLNTVVKELGLGGFARVFSGEYADDWVEGSDGWRALCDGEYVGTVYLDDPDKPISCRVEIPDYWKLIRTNRVKEFEPEAFGLIRNEVRNWLGERESDLIVDVNLAEVDLPYMGGARRDIPRDTRRRRIRARGSLHATQ